VYYYYYYYYYHHHHYHHHYDEDNADDNDDYVEGGLLQVTGLSFGHRFKRKEYSTSKRITDRASTKV
jgi:hypothetical protein